jgi:hypothetical protein
LAPLTTSIAFSAPLGYTVISHYVFYSHKSTYAKLDWDGEEVGAGGFSDGITTGDTWEVDEAGLDDALLALRGLDHLLGKSACIS